MASDVRIANSALLDLGESSINSLDQQSSGHARAINAVFDSVRDWCLEQHPWNFAKARVALQPLLEQPLFGYARAFKLPTDFLCLLRTEPELPEYKMESGAILCDSEALSISYIRRVTDPNLMPPSFREFLSASIGAKVAKAITGSDDKAKYMEGLAKDRLRTARSLNGPNSGDEEPERPDLYIRARGGW